MRSVIQRVYEALRSLPMWGFAIMWLLPTLGLLVNSFRSEDAQKSSGWWKTSPQDLTIENYRVVFDADSLNSLGGSLLNSLAISIPATIIPISIAAAAAYGFAWIDFKGRRLLFITVVSMLAIPLQVALIPLLKMYVGGAHLSLFVIDKTVTLVPNLSLNGTAAAVWLTHSGFAMPFAIFLLHNYISSLPSDIFESARVDGANHFAIFTRIVLPLSTPVLAAFAIFQFLWTWNDFLIARTMLGSSASDSFPTTIMIANLAGDFGLNEHLLPAGAFVQAFIPLVVFFALQRYFVRGILAGSVKG